MDGIDKIIQRISADAQAEADAIKAEANSQCADIEAEFSRTAAAEADKIINAGTTASEAYYARLTGASETETRRAVLSMKQELLGEAFALAEKKLLSLPSDKYLELLAKLAKAAVKTGKEEIVLSAKDRAAVGSELARLTGLKLSDETRDISGGLYLKDGNIETNCSIADLIQMGRNGLGPQVAELLFA